MAQNPILDQWGAGYAYSHAGTYSMTVTASSVTLVAVKSSPGILHYVSVNQKAGNAGGTCTIYDNTAASGTIIGVIDCSQQVTTMFYDVAAATGITIALGTTTTGVGPDLTFCFQ